MAGRAPGRAALLAALADRRIVVVCGSGGVGKTTTSAALALHLALSGRRVLACTIDPSRRLATSLGLSQLSDKPRALDLSKLGIETTGGMWAMTLDTKRAFDELVTRYTPDEAARRRILDNVFYQQVSAALAGSHEYMAMEKLLDLSGDERFDVIVLDTPPTRHALDFLEAPDRLLGFLDQGTLRWFVRPYFAAGRLTLKVASKAGAVALKLADRALGMEFLRDLSEFFIAFDVMYDGFKERAARVFDLLRSDDATFVLVTSPAAATLDEALFFHERLQEKTMPFAGFVVNRVHPDPGAMPAAPGPGPRLDADLRARLVTSYRELETLARADARSVARLRAETGAPVVRVPEFEADVHDLRGLQEVAEAIVEKNEADAVRPRSAGRGRGGRAKAR